MIASFVYLPHTKWKAIQITLGLFACFLGLNRQIGTPRLTKEYLAKFFQKEFGTTLLYLLTLFMIDKPNFAFMFPVNLYFMIGLSDFILLTKLSIFNFEKIHSICTTISKNKNDFKRGRVYIEFFLFIYAIIMMKKIGFIFPLFLFNYLRIRAIMNYHGYQVFKTFQQDIDKKLQNSRIPMSSYIMKFNKFFFDFLTNSKV